MSFEPIVDGKVARRGIELRVNGQKQTAQVYAPEGRGAERVPAAAAGI
ncbi:MAG: hypothetical protein ACLS7Z_03730 [Christensenellales bacterium]